MAYRIAGIEVQLAGFDSLPSTQVVATFVARFRRKAYWCEESRKSFPLAGEANLTPCPARATKAECRGSSRHHRLTAPAVRTR
jgi:hypothetical protein